MYVGQGGGKPRVIGGGERGLSGRARDDGIALRLARLAVRVRADLPFVLFDSLLVAVTYTGVLVLRFDGLIPQPWWQRFGGFLLVAVLVHVALNWTWGLYGPIWRHASILEARRVLLATLTSCLTLAALFLPGERRVPASVVLLGAPLVMALTGALRFHSRLFAFHRHADGDHITRIAIIGGGESGAAIVRDMLRKPEEGLLPVAILDDDPRKHMRHITGVPVIGGLERLREAVDRYGAHQALLAIPSAGHDVVNRVARDAEALGLVLKILPSVTEMVSGEVTVRDVRDLSIDDLLGRQQVVTDLDAVRTLLSGRRVLITGGGGSIGAEIARQVSMFEPAELVLLDHDETHLFEAAAALRSPGVERLVDIRDQVALARVFAQHRPDVVFHAAAHKHVPLLEAHPCEAVRTNVVGTANVVRAAAACGVERLVFVSTDKAVRPRNVMGASKRVGELLVLGAAPPGARYCAVRFGNVLGSRGSVIPTFMRQIQQGGPVTVTDPGMTRFFMSIPEAVQLVLQAAAFARGGEIFMLEMGEPVRIVELAERMIRLSGHEVGAGGVRIEFTGVRPGEKLAEELRSPEEEALPTPHPSIIALYPDRGETLLPAESLAELEQLARAGDIEGTKTLLRRLGSGPSASRSPALAVTPAVDGGDG